MSTAEHPVFTTRPAVVGHRGLGKGTVDGHLENSLASLLAAAEAGVDWVELDVTRAADGVLVVHHNPATEDGSFLVGRTSAELRSAGIATLDEVLDALPPDVGVDFDVKSVLEDSTMSLDASAGGHLLPVLRREQGRRPMLVTSFDVSVLQWLRVQLPGLACGLLTWIDFPLRIAVPMAAHLGMSVVGLHHGSFGPNRIEHGPVHHEPAQSIEVAHAAGLEVLAWCPTGDELDVLLAAGVDAVCLNDVPRGLAQVRGAASNAAAPPREASGS